MNNSKRKKRIILARYQTRKTQAQARAQVAITAAAGSAQLMHTISQPIPKHPAGGISDVWWIPPTSLHMANPDGSTGPAYEIVPAGSIVARHWPLPGEQAARYAKKLAIASQLINAAMQTVAAIKILAKTAQEWTTASSRINQQTRKNHHRICRNHRPK